MEFRKVRELLQQCRTEAFRLEVRDVYGVPGEQEPFQKFLNNEPFDLRGWFQDWHDVVHALTARGVTIRRVRIVSVPHADYQRWLLSAARLNIEAGEDIRYLPRHNAGNTPTDDWWLIDNTFVAYSLSDTEGRAIGAVGVTTDTRLVSYCQHERDRLWSLGTPYTEYIQLASHT